MKPAGLFAFGVFAALVLVLLVSRRVFARRAAVERADEVLRAEFDALDRARGNTNRPPGVSWKER